MHEPDHARLVEALRDTSYARVSLRLDDVTFAFARPCPDDGLVAPADDAPAPVRHPVRATAPGIVEAVVAAGDTVTAGAELGAVVTHRSRHAISAPVGGVVSAIHVEDGAFVGYGDVVFELTAAATPAPAAR